jgi:phage/plasmid-like protein (TIGR03299 family)
MAHEIEKAARRENTSVSWHGLEGTISPEDARDVVKFMEAAGINWTAVKWPLMSVDPNDPSNVQAVEEFIALRRSTDGALLGVHSKDYEVHNPAEVLAPIHEAVAADERFNWNFATSLRGGRIITATADFLPDYEVAGEPHGAFLFCTTSFDGTRATTMGGSTIRIVCANTLRATLESSDTRKIKIKHRTSLEGKSLKLNEEIERVCRGFVAYKDIAEKMAMHRVERARAEQMLKALLFVPKLIDKKDEKGKDVKVWTEPSTRTQNRTDKLIQSLNTSVDERGGEVSLYTMLQGITRFADHERGIRKTEGREARGESEEAIRFDSNLLGSSDEFKQEGFAMLLEQVAA